MRDGGEEHLAPIIPLFGGTAQSNESAQAVSENHPPHDGLHSVPSRDVRDVPPHDLRQKSSPGPDGEQADGEQPDREHDPDHIREVGAASLVRKLRARSLSISEARQVLRGHSLHASQVDDVIDEFCDRGYLDDAVLAEQLVISGIERKGQGRVALSRALAQRGIPRDVIDAAMGDLPDDDAERALEFARTKARSLSRLDFDTALRRLVGQLARRGYGGSIAMSAAKTALNEATPGQPPTGVRFVDSD